MRLTKAEIARLIPHAGAMCLLDGVLDWDGQRVRCVAHGHGDAANPLRYGGRLHAIAGVEYAAQAMAVHGALAGAPAQRPRAGYLAALRDVACRISRLDGVEDDLIIEAERVMGDARSVIYRFAVGTAEQALVTGRATVILDAARGQP